MAKHPTQETVNFNGYSGYYGSIAQGYGGFAWGDIDYMNPAFWQTEHTNWCDTGYQNVLRGAGEAFTWNNNGSTSYGVFETSDTSETFTLKSMVAASAWETDQPFDFRTYTYTKGQGFVLKASDTIYLSQKKEMINFAKVGKPGDFKDVAAVEVVSGTGKYGNNCSYGRYGYTTGNEMAFDNLKVQWNGQIPKKHGPFITKGLAIFNHGPAANIAAPHLVFGSANNGADSGAHTNSAVAPGDHNALHTELPSPGSPHAGNLTGQFSLPAIDHFGS
jgi:hypothetical protein